MFGWIWRLGKWLAGLAKKALGWAYGSFLHVRLAVGALILLFILVIMAELASQYAKDGMIRYWVIGAVGFVAFMSLAYQIRKSLGWEKQKPRWSSAYNDLYKLPSYEFEKFVADLFVKMGYSAKVTQKSDGEEGGDYGIDIVAKKNGSTIAVQVKRWRPGNLVGAEAVQNTLGSMWKYKADKSILITTSDFTEQAHEQAKGAPIELWNGLQLKKIVGKYGLEKSLAADVGMPREI